MIFKKGLNLLFCSWNSIFWLANTNIQLQLVLILVKRICKAVCKKWTKNFCPQVLWDFQHKISPSFCRLDDIVMSQTCYISSFTWPGELTMPPFQLSMKQSPLLHQIFPSSPLGCIADKEPSGGYAGIFSIWQASSPHPCSPPAG